MVESLESRALLSARTLTFVNGANGYAGTIDTRVESAAPTTNQAAVGSLWIDNSSAGAATEQSLIRFENLFGTASSQIRGDDVITGATLEFDCTNSGGGMALHRMLQSWSDSATWNSLGSGIQLNGVEAATGADISIGAYSSSGTFTLDVTAALQAWKANPSSNFGWAMVSTSADGGEFDSAEGTTKPKLSVQVDRAGAIVSVAATDPFATEGSSTATFVVSRTDTVGDLVVPYTLGGSATSGTDYAALSGSVTIASGLSSASIVIAASSDGLSEATETVTLTITTSATIEADLGSATLSIRDSFDGAGVSAIVPLAETFSLHSLPGARHTIYLDFDGGVVNDPSWNSGSTINVNPFSIEGTGAFSDYELATIQRAWEVVAEDFRPFGVDVTTELPNIEKLRKVGASDTEWGIRVMIGDPIEYNTGATGRAMTGSFTSSYDAVVWVDLSNSGFTVQNARTVGGIASHEVGHALYLDHDGGTPGGTYYEGHGSGETEWSPIMGNIFPSTMTTWSSGGYPSADNPEDDLAIISTQNGFSYRADDHASVAARATPLVALGNAHGILFGEGIIERNTDTDLFTFTVAAGSLDIAIDPIQSNGNLDVRADLYDSTMTLIAMSNPTNETSASFTRTLAAGTYFLKIDGDGNPDPNSAGYSDYASLGQYSIKVTPSQTTRTFQEGVGGYAGTQDTMISQDFPTISQGAATTLYIDGQNATYPAATLLRFDNLFGTAATQIPAGVLITSATLDVNFTDPGSSFTVHQMLRNWTESDTFNSLTNGVQVDGSEASTNVITTSPSNVSGWQTLDITSVLNAWLANPAANFGVLLQPGAGTTGGNDIASSESATPPKLTVRYLAPGTPVDPPSNTAPVANNDSASLNQNASVVISVLSNDTDAEGNTLTPTILTQPTHGTATLNSNGTITYTPTASYSGADSFNYRVSDGSLNSNTATVSLTVIGSPTISLSQSTFAPGEAIPVTFTNGPGHANDWIGIYPAGVTPSSVSSTAWYYTNGTRTAGGSLTSGVVVLNAGSGARNLAAGTYFIGFFASDGYSELAPRVTFTVVAPADDHANTLTAAATSIAFVANTTMTATGTIETLGDKDVFKIAVTQAGQFTINLSGPNDLDTYLKLYNSSGTLIQQDDDSGPGRGSLITRWLPVGTHYLEVTTFNNQYTGSFTLSVQHATDDYANTKNSDASLLTLSNGTATANGAINYLGDRDMFRLVVASTITLRIDLSGPNDLDTYLRVYNSAGTQIASDDDSGVGRASLLTITLTAGTYYFEAATYNNASIGNYTLRLTLV